MNEQEQEFWNQYLGTISEKPKEPNIEVGIAGDERVADELLELYLAGKKRAGSSLVTDFKLAGDKLPKVGNFWMILDSKKAPKCIVKTVCIETYQFDQVPEKVAIAEGEGDLSVAAWKRIHREFFAPYLSDWGVENLDKEIVITEFYEVVFQAK